MTQANEIKRMLLPVLHGQFVETSKTTLPGRMYSTYLFEAMKGRPPALEPWKNHKHVRMRQRANDMVASGKMKPTSCQTKGCKVGSDKTVKHHVAYDRPDNVVWHCNPHHRDLHHQIDTPMESCSSLTTDQLSNQSQRIIGMLEAQTVFKGGQKAGDIMPGLLDNKPSSIPSGPKNVAYIKAAQKALPDIFKRMKAGEKIDFAKEAKHIADTL